MMEELRAYLTLLVAERQRLASVVSREHRPLSVEEQAELARITGAITGLAQTISDLTPRPAQVPGEPVEDDADPQPDENYRIVATAAYNSFRDASKLAAQLQGDYGKWLVTSVAAVNFGGIYLIATSKFLDQSAKSAGIWPLVIGTVLIFLAGLAAWTNWGSTRACIRSFRQTQHVDQS